MTVQTAYIVKFFVLLICLQCVSSWAGQKFDLDNLLKHSNEFHAPHVLQKQMAASPYHKDALLRCENQKQWGLKNIESFFSAVTIVLAKEKQSALLVFPSTYCPEFFGAHSTPFWIVVRTIDGSYKEILSDVVDSIEILNTHTNGYRDISTRYGFDEPIVYKYDGALYRKE